MPEIWQIIGGSWDMERKIDSSPGEHLDLNVEGTNEEMTLDSRTCTNEQANSGPNGVYFERGTETYIGTYDSASDSMTVPSLTLQVPRSLFPPQDVSLPDRIILLRSQERYLPHVPLEAKRLHILSQ